MRIVCQKVWAVGQYGIEVSTETRTFELPDEYEEMRKFLAPKGDVEPIKKVVGVETIEGKVYCDEDRCLKEATHMGSYADNPKHCAVHAEDYEDDIRKQEGK